MDYRDNFAHLLRHMTRELTSDCEHSCPVRYHEGGSTTWDHDREGNYKGPSLEFLFAALKEMGYIAGVSTSPSYEEYFPTTSGIEYLEKYKHPEWVWLKENWFAVTVAMATLTVAVASIFFN